MHVRTLTVLVDANLAATIADGGISIVDATELPGRDALYGSVAMDVVALVIEADSAWHEVVHMTDFELDGNRPS